MDHRSYQRPILSRYRDPLDLIWLATAQRLGITVRRDPEVFSSSDGHGLLRLSTPEHLDPDDTLAQLIFHELCHWMTNGVESISKEDWGFPVGDDLDAREHAALRLQAALAQRHGLRGMFGPTGGFRAYYDSIPDDPLAPLDKGEREREVVELARQALARADQPPFAPLVAEALAATRALRRLIEPFLDEDPNDEEGDRLPSLWNA